MDEKAIYSPCWYIGNAKLISLAFGKNIAVVERGFDREINNMTTFCYDERLLSL